MLKASSPSRSASFIAASRIRRLLSGRRLPTLPIHQANDRRRSTPRNVRGCSRKHLDSLHQVLYTYSVNIRCKYSWEGPWHGQDLGTWRGQGGSGRSAAPSAARERRVPGRVLRAGVRWSFWHGGAHAAWRDPRGGWRGAVG